MNTWEHETSTPSRAARALIGTIAALVLAAIMAAPAMAAPGLPLSYDYKQIDSPAPLAGGAFGWGVAAGDFTGDGKNDLLIPQSQAQQGGTISPPSAPQQFSKVFIINGVTGAQVDAFPDTPAMDAIEQLETYASPTYDPVLGFVYVERMPDVGSCPLGDGADADKICDGTVAADGLIGPHDGIPEILVGGRNAQVPVGGPTYGRGYVLDGATRAIIKRIDMPAADIALQASFPQTGQQFGRVMTSLQGLPPCAGAVSEANNMGIGACPNLSNADGDNNPDTDPIYPKAVRIGDVNGGGEGDIVITARSFRESVASNEVETVLVRAASGQFTLTLNGETTADIAFNAPATGAGSVQAALEALPTPLPGDFAVTGGPGSTSGGTYTVVFQGVYTATNVTQMTAADGTTPLAGGTPSTALTVATSRNGSSTTSAQAGSQCAAVVTTVATPTCTGGRAWVYKGEDFNTGDLADTILDAPFYTVKNPFSQTTGSTEFGGNMLRVGDISNPPDGKPDFVIASRNTDYPLENPTAGSTLVDAGAAFLFSGAGPTVALPNALIRTDIHPEQQSRSSYSGSFNAGLPAGDLGLTGLPDYVMPAALQNSNGIADAGTAYVIRGDAASGGGGAQGSWQFAQMNDPDPFVGSAFGSSTTGVGNLVGGPGAAANEMMIGSWGPFDPATEASFSYVDDVHIVNPQFGTNLQTIADPTGEKGSGFGVGMTPMGDLNSDGFLDFAVTAYLSNAPPGVFAGAGRAYILYSDNTPVPTPAAVLASGDCANRKMGTDGDDTLLGTVKGDTLFALAGNDEVMALADDDCVDGAAGKDKLDGGGGDDSVLGGAGKDLVRGGAGDDRLFGMSGRDKLVSGKGDDLLDGGKGNDMIDARGGGKDRIVCGGGRDKVLADASDRVSSDCERVKV